MYDLEVRTGFRTKFQVCSLEDGFVSTLRGHKKTTYPIGYVVFLAYHEGFRTHMHAKVQLVSDGLKRA